MRAGSFGGIVAVVVIVAAGRAMACDPVLGVQYVEDAPSDSLSFNNESAGDWRLTEVVVDLGPSAGGLLLDTEPGAPGSGSSFPFTPRSGATPTAVIGAIDGARRFTLRFAGVGSGGAARFALDLDDTLPAGSTQTRVAFPELEGSVVTADFAGPNGLAISLTGEIGGDGRARLEPSACS